MVAFVRSLLVSVSHSEPTTDRRERYARLLLPNLGFVRLLLCCIPDRVSSEYT